MVIPQVRQLTEAEKARGYTSIRYVAPGKRSRKGVVRYYHYIDPKTGQTSGSISRISYERSQLGQRKFGGILYIGVPPPEEIAASIRSQEERREEQELAEQEATYEAGRIKRGLPPVPLERRGAAELLREKIRGLPPTREELAAERAERQPREVPSAFDMSRYTEMATFPYGFDVMKKPLPTRKAPPKLPPRPEISIPYVPTVTEEGERIEYRERPEDVIGRLVWGYGKASRTISEAEYKGFSLKGVTKEAEKGYIWMGERFETQLKKTEEQKWGKLRPIKKGVVEPSLRLGIFGAGVGAGVTKYVGERPLDIPLIWGAGAAVGAGTTALSMKVPKIAPALKWGGRGLFAAYGVGVGAEIYKAPTLRRKGRVVGKRGLQLTAFMSGARLGGKFAYRRHLEVKLKKTSPKLYKQYKSAIELMKRTKTTKAKKIKLPKNIPLEARKTFIDLLRKQGAIIGGSVAHRTQITVKSRSPRDIDIFIDKPHLAGAEAAIRIRQARAEFLGVKGEISKSYGVKFKYSGKGKMATGKVFIGGEKAIEYHSLKWYKEFPYFTGKVLKTPEGLKVMPLKEQIGRKAFRGFFFKSSQDIKDINIFMAQERANIEKSKLFRTTRLTQLRNIETMFKSKKGIFYLSNIKPTARKLTSITGAYAPSPSYFLSPNMKQSYKSHKKYQPMKIEYKPYKKYETYKAYKPYQPMKIEYKPYKKYETYKAPYTPYKPYQPYKPYTPYQPYKPYKPYKYYDPYKPHEPPPPPPFLLYEKFKMYPRKRKYKPYPRGFRYKPSLTALGQWHIKIGKIPKPTRIITPVTRRPIFVPSKEIQREMRRRGAGSALFGQRPRKRRRKKKK